MSANNNQGWMRDCKRRHVVEENMEDLISNLPDDVVGHILSRLPTKDALKTSVLSRAWEKKWTSIYNIDLNDICYTNYMVARFVNYVNKILVGTGTLRIRRFSLDCCTGLYGSGDLESSVSKRNVESVKIRAPDLEAWISCVSKRNVESVKISASDLAEKLDLNWCLLNWTCLKELELCLVCTLVLPVNNCFPYLKRLILASGKSIASIEIKAEQISSERRIILSFPVLEVLSLRGCEWKDVNFVEIHAPELITLEIRALDHFQNYEIQVFGSKLAMFRSLGGSMKNFYLRTPAVSNVEFKGHQLLENLALLKQLTGITCLKLSPSTVKALILYKSGHFFPTLDRLTELHIWQMCSIKDILELLQLLPPLESLYVNVWSFDQKTTCQRWPPKIMSVLKKVELGHFLGYKPELTFAAFVLENASNLKQMSVIVSNVSDIPVVNHNLSALIPESSSCKLVVAKRRQHAT